MLTAGGHFHDSDKHAKTEVYDLTQGQWTTSGDLPEISWLHTIVKDRKYFLFSYKLFSILGKVFYKFFYVFGGYKSGTGPSSTIAKLRVYRNKLTMTLKY